MGTWPAQCKGCRHVHLQHTTFDTHHYQSSPGPITYNQPSRLSTSARERGLAKAEQQSEGTGKRKGIGNTRDHVIGALGLYRQTLESLEPQSFICKTCKIRLSMAIQAQLVSVGAGLLKGNHHFPTVLFAVILCDHALNPVDWLTIVETCGNSN